MKHGKSRFNFLRRARDRRHIHSDNDSVKIPVWICSLLFSASLALQAWQLGAIVSLKADAAATKTALEIILKKL